MRQPQDMIDLANAHMTQHTNGAVKSPWSIEANITDAPLGKFPAEYSEGQMFQILDFAKKYELEAFNTGVQYGKQIANGVLEPKIEQLLKRIETMKDENERISAALEKEMFKAMGGEEN